MAKGLDMLDQQLVVQPRYNIIPVVRANIANWMNMVVINMRLDTSVLFLGMAIFDRYLAITRPFGINDPAVITVACLALAAKVESINAPLLASYMDYMDANCYLEQLRRAEIKVFMILDYKVSFIPTVYSVLCNMLSGLDQLVPVYVNLVFYLAELSILEYELHWLLPSQLAEACCCYALALFPQPLTVLDQLSALGVSSSNIDAAVAAGIVILSRVHGTCYQAAVNNNPYASTVKYHFAAIVVPVSVVFEGVM